MSNTDFDGMKAAVQVFSTSIGQQDYLTQFKNIEKTLSQIQNSIRATTASAFPNASFTFNITREIDIFSDLGEGLYSDSEGRQIASLMRKFRNTFYQRVHEDQIEGIILPKLENFIDEDGANMIRLAATWDQGNMMLYFSFEKDEKDSSYGLIWNDKMRKNYESRTGNIYLNDVDEIVHEVCDFIFRVFA